ncbi:10537_t:CDS:2, partial [Racocetra fulgida]
MAREKVRVVASGDSNYSFGEIVDRQQAEAASKSLTEAGKTPPQLHKVSQDKCKQAEAARELISRVQYLAEHFARIYSSNKTGINYKVLEAVGIISLEKAIEIQLINQSPLAAKKKNVVYYDDYRQQDEDNKSYALIDRLTDDESTGQEYTIAELARLTNKPESLVNKLKKNAFRHLQEEIKKEKNEKSFHSVFSTMSKYFQKNETYEGLFDKYPNIDNEIVIKYLERIYQQYKEHESKRRVMSFYEKSKDKAWRITRRSLGDSFTNAVKQNQLKAMLGELLQIVQFFGDNDFEEAVGELDNCHEVKPEYMKERIGKLLESRLFGVLAKAKYWGATNIFQILLFDPNHNVYRPSSKELFPIIKNSVCLFSEEDECEEVWERKKVAK